MEAGHKEKHFFLGKLLRVCVTNGGEVRGLGVQEKGGGKNVENIDVVSKVVEKKI